MFYEIANNKNPNNKLKLIYDNFDIEINKIQKIDQSLKQKKKLVNNLFTKYLNKKNKL
jgi:hypothetical protein